ncbi:MAG TPA: glucose 1-dehydrogenase [Ilumatobacter sp.]|nr:glucose 1-dehydrogenase [Ilumatobacter sp.]
MPLTGKRAVVTGGSRGIGLAIAKAYAAAGAEVVIASRKLDACQSAADEITATSGRRAIAVACNVGSWDDCDRLYDVVSAELGGCDVLVNNAGMSPLYPDLPSVTEAYYDKVAAVNLKGPFRLGALFGAQMAATTGGSIINVSTIGSLRPSANELVYACAKAGLNALTIGLADAFGPSVRSNAILPGAVMTDIADGWPEEYRASAASNPLGRAGQPHDFVGAAMFFATDASAWITGTLLRVDGGLYRQTS